MTSDADVLDSPDVLDRWEKELSGRVSTIDLIGEFGLSDADRSQIASCLSVLLRSSPPDTVNLAIRRHWSLTLAAYLVAEGAASYQAGNYWNAVCSATGLSHQFTSIWGEIFLETVERIRKPDFNAMVADQRAVRFVSRILAHGGIPSYCLDDFFRDVLHGRGQASLEIDSADLISDWQLLRNPLPFADKPVKRFLLYGGPVAQDFLNRCLEMARVSASGQEPDATLLGLPVPVVERYSLFVSTLSPADKERAAGSHRQARRYMRPWLRFDPWGGGIELILPEQALPPDVLATRLVWTLTAGQDMTSMRVAVLRRGGQRIAASDTLWVSRPSPYYVVTLSDGPAELHRWELTGVDARRPILLFSPGGGRSFDLGAGLPAEVCWAVVPNGQEMLIGHQGNSQQAEVEIPEELPAPSGWMGYHAAVIDLQSGDRLFFKVPSTSDELSLRIRARGTDPQRPRLVGGRPLSQDEDSINGILYAGSLPRLFVPTDTDEVSRWQVQIHAVGPSTLNDDLSFRLTDVESVEVPGGFEILLNAMLGERPIGAFILQVRGPLGQDANLRFRTIPELEIKNDNHLLLLDESPIVELQVHSSAVVLSDGDDTSVSLPTVSQGGYACYHLVASIAARELAVRYGQAFDDGVTAEVPLRISIRRLRWSLVGVEGAANGLPQSQVISVELQSFLEAVDPRLLLDLPITSDVMSVRVALVDADGDLQVGDWKPAQGEGRMRVVYLSAFRDSLRQSRRAQQRIELHLLRGDAHVAAIPLLAVRQVPQITKVNVSIEGTDPQRINCSWEEGRPTADRALLIWSLSRPWEPPLALYGPKDCSEAWTGTLTPPLNPGRYRASLQSVDPWIGNASFPIPKGQNPHTTNFSIEGDGIAGGNRDEILERLFGGALVEGDLAVAEVLEPLLCGDIGRTYGREAEEAARKACQRPGELASALPMLLGTLSSAQEAGLVELLVQAGAGNWAANALPLDDSGELATYLWQTWLPLGLIRDLPEAIAGDGDAQSRCKHYLGPDSLDLLDEDEDEMPIVRGGTPASLAGLIAKAQASMNPSGKTMVQWKQELASGLLGGEALVQARYESYTIVNVNEARVRWVRGKIEPTLQPLDRVLQKLPVPPYIQEVLSAERDHATVLRNIPFVVGLAALLQRLQARRPTTPYARPKEITELGILANRIAPSLYVIDLCLFELALSLTD